MTLERKTPLKRSGELKRTGRIPAKRATPRRKAAPAGCSSRGCKATKLTTRVAEGERYCDTHGTTKADDACRAFIRARDPRCVACGRGDEGVQWAHVHTRGMTYVRWDADNAVGLCARCHYAYTKRPAAWIKFVERTRPGLFVAILHRELYAESQGYSVDKGDVIRSYREGRPWHAPDPPEDWRSDSPDGGGPAPGRA